MRPETPDGLSPAPLKGSLATIHDRPDCQRALPPPAPTTPPAGATYALGLVTPAVMICDTRRFHERQKLSYRRTTRGQHPTVFFSQHLLWFLAKPGASPVSKARAE